MQTGMENIVKEKKKKIKVSCEKLGGQFVKRKEKVDSLKDNEKQDIKRQQLKWMMLDKCVSYW